MTREVQNGQSVHLQQGFRAYQSLDQGAVDYVSLMQTRFSSAMPAAEHGDVNGFASALKSSGYYTAPETEYASALHALAPNLQNTTTSMSSPETLSFSMDSLASGAMHRPSIFRRSMLSHVFSMPSQLRARESLHRSTNN